MQGMVVSILRLPMSMSYDSYSGPDTGAAAYRGPADGGHVESYGTYMSNRYKWLKVTLRQSNEDIWYEDKTFGT